MSGLGRIAPPDWEHVEKYPLTTASVAKGQPAVMGVNWYSNFDTPIQKGPFFYVGLNSKNLGHLRGGHCVALKGRTASDPYTWWDFYNQQAEGICVGEGVSRVSSQLNRKLYQPRWLYDRCKERDGDPNGEGTYVRTGLSVLKDLGHVRRLNHEAENLTPGGIDRKPNITEGIKAYRWIRSIDDLVTVLGYEHLGFVDFLQSWGRAYPHIVRMPLETLEVLWKEDGEIGVVTDR